jgi:glycosyltransferase involved in cell wall biosynthesis
LSLTKVEEKTDHAAQPLGWGFLREPQKSFSTLLGIPLNELMLLYWQCNERIQDAFPLLSQLERTAYLFWFIRHAQEELSFAEIPIDLPGSAELPNEQYGQCTFERGSISIDCTYIAYWLSRSQLQTQFDIFDEKGLFEYVVWLINSGFTNANTILSSKTIATQNPDDLPLPINSFMRQVWQVREDLKSSFDLTTTNGRASYVYWFLKHGLNEYPLADHLPELSRERLDEPSPTLIRGGITKISRLMHILWLSSPQLQTRFNLNSAVGRFCYHIWYYYLLADAPRKAIVANHSNALTENLFDEHKGMAVPCPYDTVSAALLNQNVELASINTVIQAPQNKSAKRGINFIGPLTGTFALAEHARYVKRCLEQAHVDLSPLNFHSAHTLVRESTHTSTSDVVALTCEYDASLFCTNPDWIFFFIGGHHRYLLESKFLIQFGYWELANFPEPWLKLLKGFNEVWAPSQFIYDALSGRHNCVQHMPVAVSVDESSSMTRAAFGLPERTFLFYFSFDGFSSMSRKNPLACLHSFRKAFPSGNEAVGLVMKCRNMGSSSTPAALAAYFQFLEEVKKDKRVHLIESDFSRKMTDALMSVVDCYISLHRSEGFGYGMAEAMYLGKPVVATGYSGNLDFTKPDNSCLVDYQLVPVPKGQYIFAADQVWADADIEHAAFFMRKLYQDATFGKQIGSLGQNYVHTHHSLTAVATAMQMRLASLGLV